MSEPSRCEPASGGSTAGAAMRVERAWRLRYDTLDFARLVTGARRGGLFACARQELPLLAARELDAPLLDAVQAAWTRADSGLARGRTYVHPKPPFVALPCLDGTTLLGVLVLAWESEDVRVALASALTLAPLGRVLAAVLRRLGTSKGIVLNEAPRVPPVGPASPDRRGQALLALLHEHRWSAERVARELGTSRQRIYQRMQAAKLPRPHGCHVGQAEARHRGRPAARWDAAAAASDPQVTALVMLLRAHDWSVARVARALGVGRSTVYYRMRAAKLPRWRAEMSSKMTRRSDVAVPNVADLDPRAVALVALLKEHEWNVARVARKLGQSRTTFYKHMHKVHLPLSLVRAARAALAAQSGAASGA